MIDKWFKPPSLQLRLVTVTLLGLLYLAPLAALIGFLTQAAVNVPLGDQWMLVDLLAKVHGGQARFADFFAQHNEHRLLFPKYAISALAMATGWNIYAEIGLSVLLAAVAFGGLWALSQRSLRAGIYASQASSTGPQNLRPSTRFSGFHLANLLTACLMFSWVQAENWLWGFQVVWFWINACLVWALWLLSWPGLGLRWRLVMGASLCFIASFSSAQGVFTWLAAIPTLLFADYPKQRLRPRRWIGRLAWCLGLWLGLLGLCLTLYLVGYKTPGGAVNYYGRSLPIFLAHVLTNLGMPLLGKHVPLAGLMATGALSLGLFVALGAAIGTAKPRPSQLLPLAAPWISLGSFAVIFALVNSYGRSGLGIEQALAGRYTTHSLLLLVAVIHLLPIALRARGARMDWRIVCGATAAFVALTLHTAALAYQDALFGDDGKLDRVRQSACLELVNYLDEQGLPQCFAEDELGTRANILTLDRIGLRDSRGEITWAEDSSPFWANPSGMAYADVAYLHLQGEQVSLRGYLSLPAEQFTPETFSRVLSARYAANFPIVLITADNRLANAAQELAIPSSQPVFLAAANVLVPEASYAQAQRIRRQHLPVPLTWSVDMDLSTFQAHMAGAKTLSIYLYDRHNQRFLKLRSEISLARLGQWQVEREALAAVESGVVETAGDGVRKASQREAHRRPEVKFGPAGQPVVMAHPPMRITVSLKKLAAAQRDQITLGYGLLDSVWQEASWSLEHWPQGDTGGDGVTFKLLAKAADGKETLLFSQRLDPLKNPDDRGEKTVTFSFSQEGGRPRPQSIPKGTQAMVLETLAGPSDARDWSFWSLPQD